MLTLITGGAASGKSDYAEMLSISSGADALYYVASMKPEGSEAAKRIEKHRKSRADKNFITIECPCCLETINIPAEYKKALILLEDLGNLVANEQFDVGGTDAEITARVMNGIRSLCRKAGNVLIVGNDIFCDTADYECETLRYMRLLGKVSAETARVADNVYQVVSGLAIPLKEKTHGDTEYGKE